MKVQDLVAKIGDVIGTSEWLLVDQARINAFADCTEDHQFIHVNPEMAKMTPFGGTIAHGFLTLSLISRLMETTEINFETQMSINYGFDKLRFINPVKSGQRIRGHFKLLELAEKRPGQWQQKVEVTVEIEGDEKPAMLAEWIFQHFV